MSVEIHLGYQDHHKMEDFLASGAPGVGAITLHATGAKHQHGAADAARDAGVSVLYDPRTERLAYDDPSGATQKLPGWTGQVVDIGRLSSSIDDRARLVDAVIAGHPNEVTIVTPPSFYLTRAKLVRDARGDGVEDGLRRVAGWGLRYDLVPVDADRDVSQRSQGADDLADARPGEVLEMA